MLPAPRRCFTRELYRAGTLYSRRHTSGHSRSTFTTGVLTRKAVKYARYTGYFCLSSAFGLFALGTGIFLHDACTYSDQHVERVPRAPLAMIRRGGPKNLPIVRAQVDDDDDEENKRLAERPRLVVVGGGWGVRHGYFQLACYRELIVS